MAFRFAMCDGIIYNPPNPCKNVNNWQAMFVKLEMDQA